MPQSLRYFRVADPRYTASVHCDVPRALFFVLAATTFVWGACTTEHSERTFEDIQQKPSRPNTPPTVRILPERPTSRDALYAKVESQRTTATYRYRWFINGELLEEADGSELAAGTARRGDTVLLEVAIITDAGTSPFGGYSVVIANAAPTCINAVISPAPPTTYQTIRCECLDPDDPDDDQLDSKCSWTGLSLDTDACEVSPETPLPTGTELECTLTLSDSSSTSSPTRATTAIANAPPQGGEARLVPQTITESTHVHCEADGAYDPDGVVWDYALSVDDIVLANGPNATLNGDNFNKGQTIGCIATPSDGLEGGTALPIVAAPVIVNDSPASIVSVEAMPPVVTRLEKPTCTAILSDLDEQDMPMAKITWFRNGVLLEWNPNVALGAHVTPGDTLHCEASIDGPDGTVASVASNTITVLNLAPLIISADITPAAPTAIDTLTCNAVVQDDDDDPLQIQRAWTVNGVLVTGPADSLGGLSAGDTVSCEITVTDPYGGIASWSTSSVIVQPSPPAIAAVEMTPLVIGPCDVVTCEPLGISDPDGLEGLIVATSLLANGLPSQQTTFPPGTNLQCIASVTDDNALSATAESPLVTVTNVAPNVAAAVITPASPIAGDLLTCTAVEANDPDCNNAPQIVTEWIVGEGKIAGSQLQTTLEQQGQTITCSISVSDGYSSSNTVVTTVQLASPPSLPLVQVVITSDGAVTCAPESELVAPAWFWRIGDGDEFQGPSFLPTALYSDCDRVFCRAESEGLTTNIAEQLLPYGPDCDDGSPCTIKTCSAAGGCEYQPITGACDDGEPCTIDDTCDGLACGGILNDCDDNNPCTDEICITGVGCSYGFASSPCTDNNLCTLNDICVSGGCQPGVPLLCDDGDPCTDDACDPQLGCIGLPNTATCNDDNPCTDNDVCDAGDCLGNPIANKSQCTTAGQLAGYCSEGECTDNQAPSTPDLALSPSTPQAGVDLTCLGTSIDLDAWPEALTYEFVWTEEPAGTTLATGPVLPGALITKGTAIACRATASDGLLTSPVGVVVATVANSPPTISNVDITFTNDVAHCNATIHDPDVSDVVTSEVQWINNGVPLEVTGSPALLSSLPPCTQLSCQITAHDGSATTTVTSDPAFNENPIACGQAPCTVWECTPDGCSASTLNGPCDDGDPCTTEGVCNGSICETAPLPNDICDDNNPCTQDVCEANNGCVYVPQPNTPCDADGSVCTTNDSCNQQGVCVPGAAISCDDGIACTPDTCEPTTGCTALLDSADVGFAVQFGTTQEFIAYEDEAETELVQGPQGGEHIEFSLKYTLPSAFDWQPLRSRVIVTLRSPCCGTGIGIGGMYLPNVLSDIEGPNTFVSGTLLGIFDQVINVGATVCATVEVSIYDEVGTSIIATSIARHMFTIVDEQ